MYRPAFVLAATLAILACDLFGPDAEPSLRTDRSVYQLRQAVDPHGAPVPGYYRVDLALSYTNHRGHPVYILRMCGTGVTPAWSIARPDGGEVIGFSGWGCTSGTSGVPQIEVLPGA